MANFKPQITVITEETRRDYVNAFGYRKGKSPYKTIQYKTYRELKKNIKKHLLENIEDTVSLCRSKRGEWGEWFEIWTLSDDGNPKILRQGWS